jgi:uracil-DNA glycosylase
MPDDLPPKEELEMGAEDALGRPLAGNAADRLRKLQDRVNYLREQIDTLVRNRFNGCLTEHDVAEEQARLTEELRLARQDLAAFQTQHTGRN